MSASVGCHALAWGDAPLDAVARDVRAAGYDGLEVGREALGDAHGTLSAAGLALTGTYLEPAVDDAPADVASEARRLAGTLAEAGAAVLVLGPPMRGRAPPTEGTLDAFAERAVAASEAVAEVSGVRACVHPHYDSALETPADLARFDDATAGLPLALDTAHLHLGGFDLPAAVARFTDAGRVAHVHLKDAVPPEARDEWPAATRELGAGTVPLGPSLDALAAAGYDGWLVVEQDRAADPAAEAARSREFLSERGY